MTSTNDEKEVKSYQTSGPKGKSYFIELYKSLEARLNEAATASERTTHLCDAWRRVHSLCQHSAPTTHTHLLSWLQRHTARTVLQNEWRSPTRKNDRASLEEAINVFIVESRTAAASRDGCSPSWEVQLVARGEWFKRILDHPWKHPVLNCLLNPDGTPPTNDEVLEWLKEERGVTFLMRLQTLVAEKQCDDIAVLLATAVMERVRNDTVQESDIEQTEEPKGKPEKSPTNFGDRLREEAGFTVDVLEMLMDVEFVLLHKRDSSRCIALAKQTPLRSAYQLIERLQSRLETSPREKRLWKNSKEVAVLIAQVVIARCMVVPHCVGSARSALYCCARSLARLVGNSRLPGAAAALAAPAPTAAHLHTLAAAVDAQLAQKNDAIMKPFVCELYVRAITAGMNELERLKLKTEKDTEARLMEQTLSSWFVQLGAVLASSNRVKFECALTAFSVHPSPQMYERIKAAPALPPIHLDSVEQSSNEATNPQFGSWASDSRSQTNFVKTSETLNMKARQNQVNVLSTAILNEGEALGLSPELCQDITVLLSGPRVKTLSWDMDRELLLENCRSYLERTHGGTKAVTTELKYLNLNPADFQYLPEEDEDENNIYYGIEKGYEHLVEHEPQNIWEEAYEDFDKANTNYSSDEFHFIQPQRKKKTKKVVSNSDEDDPLSFMAETKRKDKKERPNSKERNKEKKKATDPLKKVPGESNEPSEIKVPGDPLEIQEGTQDKTKDKPKRVRKKKEKVPKPTDSSLAGLVGLKVVKTEKKSAKNVPHLTDSDVDSQGISSVPSNSEDNVLYDGLYSMDEMKSRSSHSSDVIGLCNEFPTPNGRVGITNAQTVFKKLHRPPSLTGVCKASPSPYKSHSPSDCSRNSSPTFVTEEVKSSISKLLEFRRLKALQAGKKPNAIMRPEGSIAIDNNISPKAVTIPEIPKSYISKHQSEKLTELKQKVDDILKHRKNTYAGIPSPVTQHASKNLVGRSSDSYYDVPCQYNNNQLDRMTPSSSSDRCFSTPPPSDRFLDSVSLISIYDKNEPSHSRNSFPGKSSPYSDVSQHRQSKYDMSDINYQDYLHELRKLNTYNQYPENTEPKKVIKAISRVTPVVPNIKSEHKTQQNAKQMPQKKPDGSLNTFSRLNYYKNKQTDMKNKTQDMSQQNLPHTVGSKLDGFIMEHILLQSQRSEKQISPSNDVQTMNRTYEKPQINVRDHPMLTNMLQGNSSRAQNQQKSVSPQQTILSEKDQNDLLLLLRQQNSLNKPQNSPMTSCCKATPITQNSAVASCSKTITSSTNAIYNSDPSLMPPNHQIGKPIETNKKVNEGKMINIISTSIIKSADPKKEPKPANTMKLTSQGKSKKTEGKGQKKTAAVPTAHKNPEEWENVMNAILKQKTPCRGPNALDMALNKSSFEKAFEESLRNPPALYTTSDCSAQSHLPRIEYNHQQFLKISKSTAISSTTNETIKNKEKKTHLLLKNPKSPPKPKKKSKLKKSATSPNIIEKLEQSEVDATIEKLMQHNQIEITKKNANITLIQIPEKALKQSIIEKHAKPIQQRHIEAPKVVVQQRNVVMPTIDAQQSRAEVPKKAVKLNHVEIPKKDVKQIVETPTKKEKQAVEIPKKIPLEFQMKKFTYAGSKQADPFISGIPNSDYDLLDELMDDDLRKEIGELSSDEESYNVAAQGFLKDTKADKKPVSVVYPVHDIATNRPINDVVANAPNVISTRPICKQNEVAQSFAQKPTPQRPNNKELTREKITPVRPALNKPAMCLNQTNVQNVTTHIVSKPIQNCTYNDNMLRSSQITVEPNIYITAVPRPPVQNVVLIPSDLVYEGYSHVQTPMQTVANIATNSYMNVNNAPSVNIYQANQFTAPVVSPLIIASAVSVPVVSNVPCVTTVQSEPITKVTQSRNCYANSELLQPTHLATAQGNIVVDGNKLEAKASSSILNRLFENDVQRKLETETAVDANTNKSGGRKILKEVQEKHAGENIDYNTQRSQKALDTQADQERVRKKRMDIINRKICHFSGIQTIALSYSPLQLSTQKVQKEVDAICKKLTGEEDLPTNQTNLQELNNEVKSPDSHKENKSESIQVRRILLRSSNKLKNKISTFTTAPKPSLCKKLKGTVSLDTPNEIPRENDQINAQTNNKQMRVSKRIRNKSVTTPKDTKNNQTKVVNKVPSKKGTGTPKVLKKNKPSNTSNTIENPAPNHDIDNEQFFDIEAELLGSRIPKMIPTDLHSPCLAKVSSPKTKENEETVETYMMPAKKEAESLPIQEDKLQHVKDLIVNKTTKSSDLLNLCNTIPDKEEAGSLLIQQDQHERGKDLSLGKTTKSSEQLDSLKTAIESSVITELDSSTSHKIKQTIKMSNDLAETTDGYSSAEVMSAETSDTIKEKDKKIIEKVVTETIEKENESVSKSIKSNETNDVMISKQVNIPDTNITSEELSPIEFVKSIKSNETNDVMISDQVNGPDTNIISEELSPNEFINFVGTPTPPPKNHTKNMKRQPFTVNAIKNTKESSAKADHSNDESDVYQMKNAHGNTEFNKSHKNVALQALAAGTTVKGVDDDDVEIIEDNILKIPSPANKSKLRQNKSFKDSIVIENLSTADNSDPLKKKVRIKLGNGKTFIGTVSGSVNIETLLDDPEIKSLLMSQFEQPKKLYSLKLNVNKDVSNGNKILSTYVQPEIKPLKPLETVSLLSDDEEEDYLQVFETEFGKHKINSIDHDIFTKHQNKLKLKSYVSVKKLILEEENIIKRRSETNIKDNDYSNVQNVNEECVIIDDDDKINLENSSGILCCEKFDDDKILSAIPSKYVQGILSDIEDILAPLNKQPKKEPVVLIDDSSNDSLDHEKNPKPIEKIDELKNMLLKDLGVVDNIILATSEFTDDVQVTWASEAIDLTDDPVMELTDDCSLEAQIDNKEDYQKIINRKYFVKLVRCDHMVDQRKSELIKAEDDKPEEIPASVSRSASFSILEDFPVVDKNEKISEYRFDRSSPVMEVYDVISSLEGKLPTNLIIREPSLDSLKCDSEWMTTKKMEYMQCLSDLPLKHDLSSRSLVVPKLATLILNFIQNGDLVNKCYPVTRFNPSSKPIKRKSSEPSTLPIAKISKLENLPDKPQSTEYSRSSLDLSNIDASNVTITDVDDDDMILAVVIAEEKRMIHSFNITSHLSDTDLTDVSDHNDNEDIVALIKNVTKLEENHVVELCDSERIPVNKILGDDVNKEEEERVINSFNITSHLSDTDLTDVSDHNDNEDIVALIKNVTKLEENHVVELCDSERIPVNKILGDDVHKEEEERVINSFNITSHLSDTDLTGVLDHNDKEDIVALIKNVAKLEENYVGELCDSENIPVNKILGDCVDKEVLVCQNYNNTVLANTETPEKLSKDRSPSEISKQISVGASLFLGDDIPIDCSNINFGMKQTKVESDSLKLLLKTDSYTLSYPAEAIKEDGNNAISTDISHTDCDTLSFPTEAKIESVINSTVTAISQSNVVDEYANDSAIPTGDVRASGDYGMETNQFEKPPLKASEGLIVTVVSTERGLYEDGLKNDVNVDGIIGLLTKTKDVVKETVVSKTSYDAAEENIHEEVCDFTKNDATVHMAIQVENIVDSEEAIGVVLGEPKIDKTASDNNVEEENQSMDQSEVLITSTICEKTDLEVSIEIQKTDEPGHATFSYKKSGKQAIDSFKKQIDEEHNLEHESITVQEPQDIESAKIVHEEDHADTTTTKLEKENTNSTQVKPSDAINTTKLQNHPKTNGIYMPQTIDKNVDALNEMFGDSEDMDFMDIHEVVVYEHDQKKASSVSNEQNETCIVNNEDMDSMDIHEVVVYEHDQKKASSVSNGQNESCIDNNSEQKETCVKLIAKSIESRDIESTNMSNEVVCTVNTAMKQENENSTVAVVVVKQSDKNTMVKIENHAESNKTHLPRTTNKVDDALNKILEEPKDMDSIDASQVLITESCEYISPLNIPTLSNDENLVLSAADDYNDDAMNFTLRKDSDRDIMIERAVNILNYEIIDDPIKNLDIRHHVKEVEGHNTEEDLKLGFHLEVEGADKGIEIEIESDSSVAKYGSLVNITINNEDSASCKPSAQNTIDIVEDLKQEEILDNTKLIPDASLNVEICDQDFKLLEDSTVPTLDTHDVKEIEEINLVDNLKRKDILANANLESDFSLKLETSDQEIKIEDEFESTLANYNNKINNVKSVSNELKTQNNLDKYFESTKKLKLEVPAVDIKDIEHVGPDIETRYVLSIPNEVFETNEKSSTINESKESITNYCENEISDNIELIVPKHTYAYSKNSLYNEMVRRSSRNIKRKKDMSDIKTTEKKYRKGKNIDYPKITASAIADLAYAKEYKRIIDYCSTIKFSYARPFHIESIDVGDMLKAWPVQNCHAVEVEDSNNVEELLYTDAENTENVMAITDPLIQTLNEEIVNGNKVNNYKSIDISETNFKMGFGERSGRVIQKIETGITKLSAATLSDVKQYQPFSMPEVSKVNLAYKIETQSVKFSHFMNLINAKEKVQSVFKKTAVELTKEFLQDKKYAVNESRLSKFPFGLTSTEFIEVPSMKSIVNVVQVGQLPVSAAAQNPVTSDPRVTHVSDASPSQCSDNSPGGDSQAIMETEYTELTTANITLPLGQEYGQHHKSPPSQEQNSPGPDTDMNEPTQTLSIVKIELMEEETSQENQESEILENDFSPLPNNNIEYSFEDTSNTMYNTSANAENTSTNTVNTSNNMVNKPTNIDSTFTNVFNNSNNMDNAYIKNTPSSMESTYTNINNASTGMYSTSSNTGNSSNEMDNTANMGDASNISIVSKTKDNTATNIDNASSSMGNSYTNMYTPMGSDSTDISNSATIMDNSPITLENRRTNINTTHSIANSNMENTSYDYAYENIEEYAANIENNNNSDSYSTNVGNYAASVENYSSNVEDYASNVESYASNDENYPTSVENYTSNVESYSTNIENYTTNVENYGSNMNSTSSNIDNNPANIEKSTMLEDPQPQDLSMGNLAQESKICNTFEGNSQENGPSKSDQIAHAMNAAGISSETVITSGADELVNLMTQGAQVTANNFSKSTPINVMTLTQALSQVLPPPLNQTSTSENQMPNNPVAQQVLHIVQGNNAQTVINKPNGTHLLHIVQNKNNPVANGLSLVDTGLQQGGNQLIHIVNNGNQNNAQFLKRVNLLTNLTNAQGSNEQKMIQFVCKSADGKSLQLNAGHQRSMVLRLHPTTVQTAPKPTEPQDSCASTSAVNSENSPDPTLEIKSRSVYEENYAQFIQNSAPAPGSSTTICQEKATSLPKFNQVFGKQSYQENQNEINHNGLQENTECPPEENNGHLEQPTEVNNPPLLVRNSPPETTQAQPNPVQQIKQTISPMNIHTTMHGGVIYTRQIPVNIGGGQTINLITVPSTELVDDSVQKQQTDGTFVNQEGEQSSIIKLVPHHSPNVSSEENKAQTGPSNETNHTSQSQPVLTQMRIKLPMLSKGPHLVPGARLVRPSFFQIQRNVIGGTNQPVYQQLVLTTAPSLGQTIRLPAQQQHSSQSPQAQSILVQTAQHPQPSPHIPVQQVQHAPTSQHAQTVQQGHSAPPTPQPQSVQPDHTKPSNEPDSELSTLTLEQLREFDMVLEQVKERSVQPTPSTTPSTPVLTKPTPADSTDGPALATTSVSESTQQVLYAVENNQPTNVVSYVNRKSTITSATTSFVRSPDSSGIVDTPSSSTQVQITHTVTSKSTSADGGSAVVAHSKKKKKKKSSSSSSAIPSLGSPIKTNSLKPQEDEQTTQRILYILAEYKEQVENSPDKNKPAPRRRNQFPPTTGSKRKRTHCSSRSSCRREGVEMSPMHGEHGENGEDSLITLGSEDSSCGTTFSECTDCQESHSPEDSPTKVVRRLTFEQETTTQITQTRTIPQRNVIVSDGQTITVARTTTATTAKPTTTVLMPANYLLPVSMIKGGQQIAIMTNRGPKILVGAGETNAGALLFQRLIGPGLKPVLARPGVRHIRLPATALHNLQTFNIQTTPVTQVQPPDSTAQQASTPAPPDLVDTRAMSSPWQDREARDKPERGPSPDCTEPWNLPSSSIADDYGYEEIVRTDNMERTVLDAIPDRYSPDMEAQRIFDKMFDVDSKKSMYGSPRCGYDIDTSDGDDKPYPQVVQQRKDGRHHRVTHVSTAALRHKYAILEHELRLQKSLSEECEDLGVDSPSASDLFPEADILFGAPSPAHEQTIDQCHTPPPIHMPQIPQPDLDDQTATDQLLTHETRHDELDLNLDDVGEIVTVGEDGVATIPSINAEEFARSHPNTTFHTEPEDGEITIAQPPFTIAQGVKARHITFHANRVPGTVVMAPQTTVISQATVNSNEPRNTVKFTDIDNMINSMPCPQPASIPSVLKEPAMSTRPLPKINGLKDPNIAAPRQLSKFDSLLTDSKLHLPANNSARQIVQGTQVIRRLRYDERTNTRFHFEEPRRSTVSDQVKMRNDRAIVESMGDNASSPGQPELFWDSTTTERHERRFHFSESEKVTKSPFDELLNDSSAYGPHTRLDSVIKAARPERTYERTSFEGISVSGSDESRPLRTYPPKRAHTQHTQDMERHFTLKTTTTTTHHHELDRSMTTQTTHHQELDRTKKTLPRCQESEGRRRTGRGLVKRGCSCCNGSSAPPKKRARPKKPPTDYTSNS